MVDETPDLLRKYIYHYIQVDKSSFSIGVAVSSSYKNSLKLSPDSTQGDELYHRISKQPSIQNSLCNHQGYIATKGLYIALFAIFFLNSFQGSDLRSQVITFTPCTVFPKKRALRTTISTGFYHPN